MYIRKQEIDLKFTDCVLHENTIYFFSLMQAVLMKANLNSMKTEFITDFYYENKQICTVESIFYSNQILYLLSISEKIWIKYSLVDNTYVCKSLPCKKDVIGDVSYIELTNNRIYCFENESERILELNLEDMTSKFVKGIPNFYKLVSATRKGDSIFFITENNKVIIDYSIKTKHITTYYLPELNLECVDIIGNNNSLYILTSNGEIFKWKYGNSHVEKILNLRKDKDYFCRLVLINNNLVLIPKFGENIYIHNIVGEKTIEYKDYPIDFRYRNEKNTWKYFGKCKDDKFYYFAALSSNYMLCISTVDASIKWKKFKSPSLDNLEKFFKIKRNHFFAERELGVDNYLSIIVNK